MLRFNNIGKNYAVGKQQVTVLQGVSGELAAGEMVALCGPSGSGKSTLLQILGALDLRYQGEIEFAAKPFPRTAPAATLLRRQQLGFIFQRFNLVPVLTAEENVMLPLQLRGWSTEQQLQAARTMLTQVGLAAQLQQKPAALSGGQQQRVAIARAMVSRPALVIADEPTASLDSVSAQQVINLLRELCHQSGSAVLVATHDPRMAASCDRTITLHDGRILMEAAA
ncbi:ABC transporter ATP-binding protein [Shewanella sp. A3A]|nr:ABC transporter ATP-binding protein [Shewanella ferrihydritica]